jgi:hypothetical protein
MSENVRTISDIPELPHDPSTYAGWGSAIEGALQLADSWNAARGARCSRTERGGSTEHLNRPGQ